jgi:hypothetical protein
LTTKDQTQFPQVPRVLRSAVKGLLYLAGALAIYSADKIVRFLLK